MLDERKSFLTGFDIKSLLLVIIVDINVIEET